MAGWEPDHKLKALKVALFQECFPPTEATQPAIEAVAKELEYAAWKGFNQSDSEFEKGYKHAMSVAAKRVRESLTKKEGDDGPTKTTDSN
jgi:hypothetical protein